VAERDPLISRPIGAYLDALASSEPAPGGGSVAGLVGALAAGLGQMVVSLTQDAPPELTSATAELGRLRKAALASAQADEGAYSGYLEASRLPKGTPEEKAQRRAAMQRAILHAADVPLTLAGTGFQMLETLAPVIAHGNPYVLSDAEIAITLAQVCVDASLVNVRINLPLIKDPDAAASIKERGETLKHDAMQQAQELRAALAARRSNGD